MPMILTPEQAAWFGRMRADWLRVMRPPSGDAPTALFPPLRPLPPERLARCAVLPDREALLARLPPGGTVAELGTGAGHFAERILAIPRPARLHLIDIEAEPLRARCPALLDMPGVRFHRGDSATVLATFPDEHFDWIYVDGDHSYAGVSRDIHVARRKVKRGGLLVFNDFTLWSPADCIDYGVPHAVCELAADHGFDLVYLALHPHLYNDVALRRPLPSDAA